MTDERNKPHRVEHTTTGNEVKRLETFQTVRRSLTSRTTQTRFKTPLVKPVHNHCHPFMKLPVSGNRSFRSDKGIVFRYLTVGLLRKGPCLL